MIHLTTRHKSPLSLLWGIAIFASFVCITPLPSPLHERAATRLTAPSAQGTDQVIASVAQVSQAYAVYGKGVDQVRAGHQPVPPIFLTRMPQGLLQLTRAQTKKTIFIGTLLPLLLQENQRILKQRQFLLDLAQRTHQGVPMSQTEKRTLAEMGTEYRVSVPTCATLLQRVDVIPISLALAQSILETGFGCSLAAQKKCSVFGMMATKTCVASFPDLQTSVQCYMRNLNRHGAYAPFRLMRSECRKKMMPLCGVHLAKGLIQYSVRKQAYVQEIQHLIRHHRLDQFDMAQLAPPLTA